MPETKIERRDARAIAHLGIDEKSFGKDRGSVTVLTEIDGSRVVEIHPGRRDSAADLVLHSFSVQQRRGVRAIAADMLPACANAAAKHLPNADLAHDRFHIARHLGEAVDKVRSAENKALMAANDDHLKGSRQVWLFSRQNF